MLRLGVLVVGCLTFLGLATLAAGPLHASTPPPPTPVLLASTPTPAPRSNASTPTPPGSSSPGATVTALPTAALLKTAVPSLLAPAPSVELLDAPELRAVWVDAFHDGFKTQQQVDQLVAWARAANINALFVEVRKRGDAYYLNSFEPRADDPDFTPGFDALQYLIEPGTPGPTAPASSRVVSDAAHLGPAHAASSTQPRLQYAWPHARSV